MDVHMDAYFVFPRMSQKSEKIREINFSWESFSYDNKKGKSCTFDRQTEDGR